MGRTNELIQEYDTLGGRNPPLEEIVAFLREGIPNGDALFHLMRDSTARGYILQTPPFLPAVRDDDDEILKAIGSWMCDRLDDLRLKVDFVGRTLGMKGFIPDRICAFLWNAIRELAAVSKPSIAQETTLKMWSITLASGHTFFKRRP